MATIGQNKSNQFVRLDDGTIVELNILDTAGQEKYDSINEMYYKQADCCLLVYDITSKVSFEELKTYYIPKIKENCGSILKVILLGNKADLKEQREVSENEGLNLATENKYIFMESSCKDNLNVSDAFSAIVQMTNFELKKSKKIVNLKLDKEKNNNNKAKTERNCC